MITSGELGGGDQIISTVRFWGSSSDLGDSSEGKFIPPKSIILYCHGSGHHCRASTIFRLAVEYSARGHAFVSFDCEGCGTSSGLPGLIISYDRWCTQAVHALAFARSQIAHAAKAAGVEADPIHTPAYIMGESMGGALALHIAMSREDLWSGIILLAPMCGISPRLMPAPPVVMLLRCMAMCCPAAPLVPMEDHLPHCFKHSRDRVIAEARKDPLRYQGTPRLGTGLQSLMTMEAISEHASKIKLPIVILHGTADVVTDPEISFRFWERCSSEDKTYMRVDGAWHTFVFDDYDTRLLTLEFIDEWIHQRVSGAVLTADEAVAAASKSSASTGEAPAPRVLRASGSCVSGELKPGDKPAPPSGQWWRVDPTAVEGGRESTDDREGIVIRVEEGPKLGAIWLTAPERRRFPRE
jgi:acylglycerol lipase